MKTLFRVLTLAIFLTAFSALTFGQADPNSLEVLYPKMREELKGKKCGERDAALATGRKIVELHSGNAEQKEVIDWVKNKVAEIEKGDPRCKLNTRYDATYQAKNWAEFLSVSKQILAMEGDTPLGLDILLTQVSVSYDRGSNPAEALSDAKMALQKIESGKTSSTGNYGVFETFKTKDFPNGKENAQGWMNYIIGWTMYNKLNQKNTDALSYLYKVTQLTNENKNDANIYTTIGAYFSNEASRLYNQYMEERKANNNEDNDAIKAKLALARGNAERSIDAFGRANKIVAADPKVKPEAKKVISDKLAELYKFRFNMADAKPADVDRFVSELVAKPMPNPTTEVTPVVLESSTSTTTTSMTNTTVTTTTTTTSRNTPSNTTPTTTTTTTTKTTKTAVKKPVTKKKGTR